MGPTYEAGLPACTQGAVGRVVTGLRVGGEVKKIKLKMPLLKRTHGQGGKKKTTGDTSEVRAAHRLDRGRVRRFPDWTVRPGEIRGRCLKKQITAQLTAAPPLTQCTETLSQRKPSQDSVVSAGESRRSGASDQQQAPADKRASFCLSLRSRSFMTYDFLRSCWNKHSSRS